jgi:hypothetical protein
MPEGKQSSVPELFMTIWIIVRVGLILVVWILLFLALFLGYFMVPIFLVAIFALIYGLSDAAFIMTSKMQEKARGKHEEMAQARQLPGDEDHPI